MAYRSEGPALAAELAELESDIEAVVRLNAALGAELALRRSARRWRILAACFALVLGAGLVLWVSRFVAQRGAAREQAERLRMASSEVAQLEERVRSTQMEQRRTESLTQWKRSLEVRDDGPLFEAVRAFDPSKSEDAWWIVAHAACRLPYAQHSRRAALENLPAERRAKAGAFCAETP